MNTRRWIVGMVLATFGVLLYYGAAIDWFMPRNILG